VRDAEHALAVRPHSEAYFVLGRDFQRQQKHEEAVTAYDDALKVSPANTREFRRGQTYLHRGEALLQLGKFKEAIRSLDRSLSEGDRDNAYIFQLRGLARAKLDDYPGAVSDYTQALALRPDDSKTHAYRGWVYLVEEALRPALHDFEAAIRLDANNGDAYNGRGYIRVRLGEVTGAVQDAEEALRRGPHDPRMIWNSARIYAQSVKMSAIKNPLPNAAELALRRQHQERALQLLGDALASTPAAGRAAFWRSYVQPDVAGAFAPLRRSPEFVRLASEYEQASN
jgi:tetratricopeptide (TPR) repeat protein